jgi:hypothetical protein
MYILLVCGCWKGKHVWVDGRLVFINSMMTSMILFMLCFFEVRSFGEDRLLYIGSYFSDKMITIRKIRISQIQKTKGNGYNEY